MTTNDLLVASGLRCPCGSKWSPDACPCGLWLDNIGVKRMKPISIGTAGSILKVVNGIPTWIS